MIAAASKNRVGIGSLMAAVSVGLGGLSLGLAMIVLSVVLVIQNSSKPFIDLNDKIDRVQSELNSLNYLFVNETH